METKVSNDFLSMYTQQKREGMGGTREGGWGWGPVGPGGDHPAHMSRVLRVARLMLLLYIQSFFQICRHYRKVASMQNL